MNKEILALDIGGTNSRFARFVWHVGEHLELMDDIWLDTKDVTSFSELIENFRGSGFPLMPEDAAITSAAVAGPIERGVYANPPLISWDIDLSNAEKDFGMKRVVLINDFVAQAYACVSSLGKEAEVILEGEAAPDATIAVIGAGTGFGKAALVPNGHGGYAAMPSEGGHSSFPFETGREEEYHAFLKREVEDEYITPNIVVSGRGISLVHRFLAGEELSPEDVMSRATEDSETIEWAARFYGRTARNFALETLSTGGLFISGGVAAKNPVLVKHPAFRKEFRRSSTMGSILAKIPVRLIANERSGLWGAAARGMYELGERNTS